MFTYKTMSQLLKSNVHFFLLLANTQTSQQQKRAILKTISKYQVNAISELALNIIKGTVALDTEQKQILKRHAKCLRIIAQRKNSIAARRSCITIQLVEAVLSVCHNILEQLAASSI